MATQNPAAAAAFVQNENIKIHGGKGAGAVKPDGAIRTEKKKGGLKDRKALADLSRPAKPPATAAATAAEKKKNRSAAPAKDNVKSAVRSDAAAAEKPPKGWELTDEEISKCREWAEEGIEYAPFTGNDAQKLDRDILEERISKEVQMVMNSLEVWNQRVFDVALPPEEPYYDFEHLTKLEMDPEVDLPMKPLFTLGDKKFDDIFLETEFPLVVSRFSDVDIKLKDFDDN